MVKQKLWVKKRTSRGSGRSVNHLAKVNPKNIDRDIRKNQLIYSKYLLKFVVVFAVGLVWFHLGVPVGPMTTLPVGLIIGLVIISLESFQKSRWIEAVLLLIACLFSWLLPIGVVL